jgi:hypothetical protein
MSPNREPSPGGNRTGRGKRIIHTSVVDTADIDWRLRQHDDAGRADYLLELRFRVFVERSHRLVTRPLDELFVKLRRDPLIRTHLERRVAPTLIGPTTNRWRRTINVAVQKIEGLIERSVEKITATAGATRRSSW